MNIAEGGAWAARAALMAIVNADPPDAAQFVGDLATAATTWHAGGDPDSQKLLAFLSHVQVNGQLVASGTEAFHWAVFVVDWARDPLLKLRFLTGGGIDNLPSDEDMMTMAEQEPNSPLNSLGEGWYRAVVLLVRRSEAHGSCSPSPCYVHFQAPATVMVPLKYRVVADGQVDPQFRRRVTLEGEFKVVLGNTSFAQWLSFSNEFTLASGQAVYFYMTESYDGPIHTNGHFRFWGFPKFGTPDVSPPCEESAVQATRLTSTRTYAVFRRPPGVPGSPVETTLEADEWVEGTQRIAAPVLPDCTPGNFADDVDNPVAQFRREFDGDPGTPGIQPVTVPLDPPGRIRDSYGTLQRAVALGWSPTDKSPNSWEPAQWNARLRAVVPELRGYPPTWPVPDGIYVPVVDANGNRRSDDGEALAGGIYVQGDLQELVMSNWPPGTPGYPYCQATAGERAYYYLLHRNGQKVTIEVDREWGTTRVTNTAWPPESRTRSFIGVPRGFQGGPEYTQWHMVIYVHGGIGSDASGGVWGTVEENEQVLVTAARAAGESGTRDVWIRSHIRYERAPNPYDVSDNPRNLFGLYVPTGSVRIPRSSPDDLDLQGVIMAGQPGVSDGVSSEMRVESVCSLRNKGDLRVLGGVIGEYVGVSGCVGGGGSHHGYSDRWVYDRRMSRGFAPPYFPTTTIAAIATSPDGSLAGVRPAWREGSP